MTAVAAVLLEDGRQAQGCIEESATDFSETLSDRDSRLSKVPFGHEAGVCSNYVDKLHIICWTVDSQLLKLGIASSFAFIGTRKTIIPV